MILLSISQFFSTDPYCLLQLTLLLNYHLNSLNLRLSTSNTQVVYISTLKREMSASQNLAAEKADDQRVSTDKIEQASVSRGEDGDVDHYSNNRNKMERRILFKMDTR